GKAGETGLARNGKQPAFHEILLAGGKREAGALLEHPAQELVVGRSHDEAPVKSSSSFGAMRSSGSTAAQRPARAALPAFPKRRCSPRPARPRCRPPVRSRRRLLRRPCPCR